MTRPTASVKHRAAAVLLVAVAVVSVLPAACGGDGTVDDGPGAAPTTASSEDYLQRPELVPRLIRERFGERPTFRSLYVGRDWFRLQLRDPRIPENLDDWEYRDGEWSSTPVSVTMSEIQELDQRVFTVGDIDFAAIPSLVQQAFDGLELEDEEVSGVSYDRIAGQPPRVYIGVSGARGSGRLLAGADGTGVEVTRN